MGGDIGCDTVDLDDTESLEELDYRLGDKYISLKEMNVRVPETLNLLDIDSGNDPSRTDGFCQDLEPAPWGARYVENLHSWTDDIVLLLDLEKFEGTASSIPELLGFVEILISDDIWGLPWLFFARSDDDDVTGFSLWSSAWISGGSDVFLLLWNFSCENLIHLGATSGAGEFLWCRFWS